jgi:NADH:ubiquinone reductase (H+-translocating)
VIGGGPTGVEFAGALVELVRTALHRDYWQLDMAQTRIYLLEGLPVLLNAFQERLQQYTLRRLQKLGVEVRLGVLVTGVEGTTVRLNDGGSIEAATVLWAAGVKASPLAEAMDLPKGRAGRIIVEPDLSLAQYPEVFVVGDLAYIEQEGKPVPQLAQPAIQSGEYVAEVIVKQRLRGEAIAPFHYTDIGTMAVIGRGAAVAQFPRPPLHFTGFLGWLIWLFVHLMQLVGFRNRVAALVDWGFSYLRFDSLSLITAERAMQQQAHPPAGAGAPPHAASDDKAAAKQSQKRAS